MNRVALSRAPSRALSRGRTLGLLIWLAYVILPTDTGGLLHGVPLGPVEAVALLVIAWLAVHRERMRGAAILALMLGVSLVASAVIPGTSGFQARYVANGDAEGAYERGTEHPGSPFTRVDRRLDFAQGGTEFPLAFFNDPTRFNFYTEGQPNRGRLAFAVNWSGFWFTEDGTHTLYLDAPLSSAQVFVDGAAALSVSPEAGPASKDLSLTGGSHRLTVVFSSPYAGPRRFSAGTLRGGQRQPFDSTAILTQRIRPWQMWVTRVLRLVKTGVDACALGWLAWMFALSVNRRVVSVGSRDGRRRRVFSLFLIVAAVEALVFAWPWSHQTMILVGGDDTLTYESYARDILLNGILMNRGVPLGHGEPFYYQAFYPYFLAGVHALFGEGMFGVMLVQRLLVVLIVWMVVEIAVELGGEDVWPAALGGATLFACWKFWPVAEKLVNESLYVPLLMAWTAVLVRMSRAPSMARAVGAGLLGGFAAITRSTILIAWVVVFPGCWTAWRHAARRGVLIGALVACSIGVFSLIAVRNWMVAGQFVPMPTELGVTLFNASGLPEGLTIDPGTRGALYTRVGLSPLTAQVVEYAIREPRPFALTLWHKALFVLGFFEAYAPGWGNDPAYIAVWIAAGVGLALAFRARRTPVVPLLLPALIALTQFAVLVLVYPKDERLILPVHMLLLPYALLAVRHLARAGGWVRILGHKEHTT